MTNLDSILKQRRHIANKGLHSQSYVLSSSHIWMWELDHQEGWVWKIYFLELWCWRILLRVQWTIKIKTVNPKRNQPWIFIGRTDAEAETPILWPPDAKSWLIGKDPGAGKDWRQKKKGVSEEEMVSWHHWLNEHAFEDSGGQRSLVGYPGLQRVRHDLATEQQATCITHSL